MLNCTACKLFRISTALPIEFPYYLRDCSVETSQNGPIALQVNDYLQSVLVISPRYASKITHNRHITDKDSHNSDN